MAVHKRIVACFVVVMALPDLLVAFARPTEGAPISKDRVANLTCSSPLSSVGGHGFNYCGDHWQRSKLPVRFRVNRAGTPPMIATDFVLAADLAADVWSLASPVQGTGPRPSRCVPLSAIICIESITTSGGVSASDGVNTILWQNLGATAAPGYAAITTSGDRIVDVDIVLNGSLTWYWGGTSIDPIIGVAFGPVAPFCPNYVCPLRYDIQAILMHEFGHALGLLHVNPGSSAVFPEDVGDAPDYNLVMYPVYYPNNATQRALGWGDLLGLQVVMSASASDP